ncbi:hypothetical protein EDB19DRAFT_1824121 [Suillus lakei]|nr:hypothetical protein EDB19DRAFT_1824121 [Suillus lakei]
MGDVFGVVGNAKIWGVGIMWEGPDMRSNLFLSVGGKFPQDSCINMTGLPANGVMAVILIFRMEKSVEGLVLSGTYECTIIYAGDAELLNTISWILATLWEVLALCLTVWIAVKHFHELRQHSAGGIIGDCFMVLMKTHMSYFVSFLLPDWFFLSLQCCQWYADLTLYMRLWFIISTGPIFPGISDLYWFQWNLHVCAAIFAGTTPDP